MIETFSEWDRFVAFVLYTSVSYWPLTCIVLSYLCVLVYIFGAWCVGVNRSELLYSWWGTLSTTVLVRPIWWFASALTHCAYWYYATGLPTYWLYEGVMMLVPQTPMVYGYCWLIAFCTIECAKKVYDEYYLSSLLHWLRKADGFLYLRRGIGTVIVLLTPLWTCVGMMLPLLVAANVVSHLVPR